MRKNPLAVILLAATFLLTGCSTWEAIPVHDALSRVNIQDAVRVTTKDGRRLSFLVKAVHPDALVGEQVRVSLDEIAYLEKRVLSPGKTIIAGTAAAAGAIVIVTVVIAVVAVVALAVSL